MSGFLLDTNIVSEGLKRRPHAAVSAWVAATPLALLHLSVLTLGEIRKGIDLLDVTHPNRARLQTWLEGELREHFRGRILDVTADVADRWGQIEAHARRQQHTLPAIDGLLAATALQHNLTLVTRNASHVAPAGISVFNPWENG